MAPLIDERFLRHRLKSTSVAGITATAAALLMFLYHVWFDHRWSWELLSIGLINVAVKLSLMTWYHFND
jgi:hypothetical protein